MRGRAAAFLRLLFGANRFDPVGIFTVHLPVCPVSQSGSGGDCPLDSSCIFFDWQVPTGAVVLQNGSATTAIDFSNVSGGGPFLISVIQKFPCLDALVLNCFCSAGGNGLPPPVLIDAEIEPFFIQILAPQTVVLPSETVCVDDETLFCGQFLGSFQPRL